MAGRRTATHDRHAGDARRRDQEPA